MIVIRGHVNHRGSGDFTRRMTRFPEAFHRATGETLIPGTLNVKIDKPVPVKEHFRILGTEINEPEQDLVFEVCRINGTWAYRIRPLSLKDGSGGWGDDILEITCSQKLPNSTGTEVEIALFRDAL